MNLRVDVRRLLATYATRAGTDVAAADATDPHDVDLRRLPWADGSFAAIELDDLPEPGEWTVSGPALDECRRVLKRNGLLEVRTRRLKASESQATQTQAMGTLTRLLQNHGFDIVSMDPIEDAGSMISAVALRGDGPEDIFEDGIAATATHVTLHGPMLESENDSAANRALAVSLDARGVKVRVRVIFNVIDALFCD